MTLGINVIREKEPETSIKKRKKKEKQKKTRFSEAMESKGTKLTFAIKKR